MRNNKGDKMFDRKDEIIGNGAAETIVGTSVKLKGTLKSDGDITIDGNVNGEVKTKGTVNVGVNAHIIANVQARNVIISGTVQGNVAASERITLTETGRVFGDISANILAISAGALFSGKSSMAENVMEPAIELTAETETPEEEIIAEETK